MALEDEIQQLLDMLLPLYKEIQQQRAYLLSLETVHLAKDEYKGLMAQEEEQLERLQMRKQELEEERHTLIFTQELRRVHRPQIALLKRKHTQFSLWHAPQSPSVNPSGKKKKGTTTINREEVKKFVNRWKFVWKIDPVILGQFNRIVVNSEHPIGEAIALLDWNVFSERMYARESLQNYLERLKQWHEAMRDYHISLRADIATQEVRFRGLLPIWSHWLQKDQPQGQERWQNFIKRSRLAMQEESKRIAQEIDDLVLEIAYLKEQAKHAGEH